MKKEITYYLKDLSRLEKVSIEELNSWANEMPFYQPLQMLIGIKTDMENKDSSSKSTSAIHFAQDVDELIIPNIEMPHKAIERSVEGKMTESKKVESEIEDNIIIASSIGHNLADDAHEDQIIDEILEKENLYEEVLNEDLSISESKGSAESDEEDLNMKRLKHTLADDALEDQVIDEVMELIHEEKDEDPVAQTSIESLDNQVESNIAKVDFNEFYPDTEMNNSEAESASTGEHFIAEKKKKKEKKSTKKKNKKKADVDLKKAKKKKKVLLIKESVAQPSEEKKKKIKGGKDEQKKVAKQSEIDFENISSYASWLLQQEPVNGKSSNSKKEKKGKKKKGKKKSAARLKADASVQKKEKIISEPLADILAQQGHSKKAKKMYERLAKSFPEKNEYFQNKINDLYNK